MLNILHTRWCFLDLKVKWFSKKSIKNEFLCQVFLKLGIFWDKKNELWNSVSQLFISPLADKLIKVKPKSNFVYR